MAKQSNMGQKEHTVWLKKEVEAWKDQGIIDEYQAQKILSEYGLAETPPEPEKVTKEDRSSRLITVVSALGALLVGIGAILFVASNWDKIPYFIKLILLFGTTFATYFAGWRLKFDTKSHPKLGHALLFLASILIGATIFLTAQIFNVSANAHWLVLLWFLAISPFGYAFNSKHILGLNIFTFALWMILYISVTRGLYLSTYETFMLYLLFGISLYGFGQLHSIIEKYSHFRLTYQGVGLFFILISYFYFSLETPYTEIFGEITTTDWTIKLLFVSFGITALVSIVGSAARYEKFKTVKHEFFVLLLAFLGWIGIWLLTFFKEELTIVTTRYGYTYTTIDPSIAIMLFIVFNLIFFIISIGSILIGYYMDATPFVNVGIFFFVLGILHLYFTTLYELLPRSIAFIIGGLILLGGGWYLEKKRRSLIRDIEARRNE